jgi:5-methylcytosine-specific restriction endonuclease McrA
MKCWICGNDADSGEHRIKKSDLITLHGKGPYKAGNSLVMIKDGKQIPIQGPNSKYLKYTQNLCEECNNSTTQKYDIAYSKFVTHLNTNENEILKKSSLILSKSIAITLKPDKGIYTSIL